MKFYVFRTSYVHLQEHFIVHADCIWHFFVIKPTRCTNFTKWFCHENLHVSDSSSVHHQEFIHCTLSNGICHTGFYTAFEDGTPSWSCSKAVYKPARHIQLLSVQWINSWWWAEELSETCRDSWQICEISASSWFYYKEICYDARSHERKIVRIYGMFNRHLCKQSVSLEHNLPYCLHNCIKNIPCKIDRYKQIKMTVKKKAD